MNYIDERNEAIPFAAIDVAIGGCALPRSVLVDAVEEAGVAGFRSVLQNKLTNFTDSSPAEMSDGRLPVLIECYYWDDDTINSCVFLIELQRSDEVTDNPVTRDYVAAFNHTMVEAMLGADPRCKGISTYLDLPGPATEN